MMKSIAFPNMFNNTSTNIVSDREATLTNLKLLLLSDRGGLLGDPYYGTLIKKMMFEQNTPLLKDILIDEIYTVILQFMPQILVKRSDIQIVQRGTTVYLTIRATNMLSYTTDLYTVNLLDDEVK